MTTDKVRVYSNGEGMEKALALVEKYGAYWQLPSKEEMHLRLLAEETIGMIGGITGSFEGEFWLEKKNNAHHICLHADTYMDSDMEEDLLSVSSDGKNAAAVGVMGKIRCIIESAMRRYDDMSSLSDNYSGGMVMYGSMGMSGADELAHTGYEWSLNQYRNNVESERNDNEANNAAWDELEKSIVANLADDVRVAIRGDIVDMTIVLEDK